MSEWARPAGPGEELDVFPTGTTLLLARDDPGRPSPVGDLVRRASHEYHARSGYRPGTQIPMTSGRRNGVSDIVRPVLLDPRRACACALSGELFAEPIAGFRLDPSADDAMYLLWNGFLTGAGTSGIPVALHLLASPSMVVTVLELTPRRRLGHHHRSYLRDGVSVADRIAHRLTLLTDP